MMTDEQEMELYEELKLVYAENEKLRTALSKIRDEKFSYRTNEAKFWKMQDIARDALEGK
jgi:hypothetical protein